MPPECPVDGVPVEDEPVLGRTRLRSARRTPDRTRHRSERDIQAGCVAQLNLRGYAIVTTGSRYLPTGTPDILACVAGRFLAVEVKRPGNRPTAAQLGQLRRWQLAGALVGWVCGETDLRDLLDHAGDPAWRNNLTSPGAPAVVESGN